MKMWNYRRKSIHNKKVPMFAHQDFFTPSYFTKYVIELFYIKQKHEGKVFALWGIERSGFFNGREKWAKGFENQRV